MVAIVLAPEAVDDLRGMEAYVRATVRTALETHLRHGPGKASRSRIKRLRGLRHPQYRLRVGDIRVFYDVSHDVVEIPGDRGQIGGRVMARTVRRVRNEGSPTCQKSRTICLGFFGRRRRRRSSSRATASRRAC